MTDEQLIELLRRAHNAQAAQAIADVGAMMGECAGMEPVRSDRTIGDVRGRYEPQSELGKHIRATVDREMARIRAARSVPKEPTP